MLKIQEKWPLFIREHARLDETCQDVEEESEGLHIEQNVAVRKDDMTIK